MNKIWLIAARTYRERLRSGMFLILTFGVPLLMIVAGAVAFFAAMPDEGDVPPSVGYVDQTGELAVVDQVTPQEDLTASGETIRFTPYATVEAAEAAYLNGEIGGYLLVPAGYTAGEAVTYFSDEDPGTVLRDGLRLFLRHAQLPGEPDWLFQRLDDPATYTYVSQASGESISEGPALVIRLAMPAFLAIVFILAVLFGTTQMGAAIIREKEQRAMEIVITSLRPMQLVAGKILGMTLLSLTQFGIWTAGGVVALVLAFSDQLDLQGLVIPWGALLWGLLLIIPGYFLFALLAAGMGILAGDAQQAQQLAGIISILGLVPIYVLGPVLSNPDGPFALALTLFPFTSPSITLIRSVFTDVPTWQLLAALAILLASLGLAVWLVTRIFRAAMLNYGKALRPREVWRALAQS
jgi:ABC-2 type transport system permease protein